MSDPLDGVDTEAGEVLEAYAAGGELRIVVRTLGDHDVRVIAPEVDRALLATILRRAADILAPAASKALN